MNNKLIYAAKNNKGSLSLEMVLVTMIMFPIIVSLIIGSYAYFTISSENTNLNFKAGRFVSTTGCEITRLQSTIPSISAFNGYKVIVAEGANIATIQDGTSGTITIMCNQNSDKGDDFTVTSTMKSNQNVFKKYFGDLVARKAIYVQEVTS